MFLQQPTMGFDGSSVVSLPANSHPSLVTDLTIFATVCQDIGNDGYVVGKGVNDRMRDFGLYLRSSKRTIWLAYGAEGNTPGFREILFFYDVSVADGSCHTVSAVIDSASNRAVLYIDGKAVGLRSPLPSFPEFRPGVSKDTTKKLRQSLDVIFIAHNQILSLPFLHSSTCYMWEVGPVLDCSASVVPSATCLLAQQPSLSTTSSLYTTRHWKVVGSTSLMPPQILLSDIASSTAASLNSAM